MRMIRLTLSDGTIKEMSYDEMHNISMHKMDEAMDGKAIIKTEFYEEDGN